MILTALSDALGDDLFRRAPVTADMILAALDEGGAIPGGLEANV